MIRRPPRSTQSRSSAASDVYKRQRRSCAAGAICGRAVAGGNTQTVSYTHLRAHETRHDLVCRLLLEKKKNNLEKTQFNESTRQKKHHPDKDYEHQKIQI